MFAFVQLTFDFSLWTEESRTAYTLLASIGSLIPISILDLKEK